MSKQFYLSILGVASGLIVTYTAIAADVAANKYNFHSFNSAGPVRLNFAEFKIRIDGWDRDYIEVQMDLKPKSKVMALEDTNTVGMVVARYKAPWWEPAFRIKVPQDLPVIVIADQVWAKDCTIKDVKVNRAYVRNCTLLKRYSTTELGSRPWWRRQSAGWQVLKLKHR